MGLRINTNVSSINAQRNLANSTDALSKSLQRLSSGLRIYRASDDAAGLAISERFRSDIRSLGQASLNANDGISLLQVAEGALNETSALLVRMRQLAIQSANGTLGSAERTTINNEFRDLAAEIDRIANVTEFNGTQILVSGGGTGSGLASVTFQIGINATANDTSTVSGVNATANGISITSGTTVDTVSNATTALGNVDSAINTISNLRASFGTVQNRLESAIRSIAVAIENTSAAESRIRDVDVASETADLTKNQVLQQAGVAILAQANVST